MTGEYAALRTEKPCKLSLFRHTSQRRRTHPARRPTHPARRPKPRYLRRVAQPLRLRQRLELLERVVLDLPDPLARDVERPPDLLQRVGTRAGQPEAHLDHLALALR